MIRAKILDHDGVEFIEAPRHAIKEAMLGLCDDLTRLAFEERDQARIIEARDLRDRVKALA